MTRSLLSDETFLRVLEDINGWLMMRLQQKGKGTFASTHEIRGIIAEEYQELCDAMHDKNYNQIVHELRDLIVAGIIGLACIKQKTLDW